MPWADEVRAVFQREVDGRLEGRALIEACTDLALQLQRSKEVSDVPHAIWHYLSDADIRRKDIGYARAQRDQVRQLFDRLERGEPLEPVAPSTPASTIGRAQDWGGLKPMVFALVAIGAFALVAVAIVIALSR